MGDVKKSTRLSLQPNICIEYNNEHEHDIVYDPAEDVPEPDPQTFLQHIHFFHIRRGFMCFIFRKWNVII